MKFTDKTADRLMIGGTFVDRFGFQGAEGSLRADLHEYLTGRPNTFPAVQVTPFTHYETVTTSDLALDPTPEPAAPSADRSAFRILHRSSSQAETS